MEMSLEKIKAIYALALFMKTEVKISEFLKPRIGINGFFGYGNPFFKELLLEKRVHEDIVRDVFELTNSNIEFVRTNIMTSEDRKAFSKVRNSFIGMPKAKIRLDLIHAHAIMVWFYDLIEIKGFMSEYVARVNALLANDSIVEAAEKVFDTRIDCSTAISPEQFFDVYKELIKEETAEPKAPVLNPDHMLPTFNMVAVRETVANTAEYLRVYEPLMCVLYEKEYSGGDVAKILKVSAESIIKFVNKFGTDETKEIRERCMKAIRKKCNVCHTGKYVEGVAKANVLKWIDKDGKWIVDEDTFNLVTEWEYKNIDLDALSKTSMPVPTTAMKVLKDNSETASKYLLNYLELIPMLRTAFGLKNNQICQVFDVTMPQLSAFIYRYIKRENMPAPEYKSEYSIKMAAGEFPEELERFILEWECEHLKATQTINSTPKPKEKEKESNDMYRDTHKEIIEDLIAESTNESPENDNDECEGIEANAKAICERYQAELEARRAAFLKRLQEDPSPTTAMIVAEAMSRICNDGMCIPPAILASDLDPFQYRAEEERPTRTEKMMNERKYALPSPPMLIVPKNYFSSKAGEDFVRMFFSMALKNTELGMKDAFELGLEFAKLDIEEQKRILGFVEAIEEEFPECSKLSEIIGR